MEVRAVISSEVLLCFTTHYITDFPAKIMQFPAFLAMFRRKEALIMKIGVLTLTSMGENTTFILYSDIKNSRHQLYEYLTLDKN